MKPYSLLILLIFFTVLHTILAADLGSRISASDHTTSWSSPNGTFSFTFIPDPTGATPANFAAIIFDNNPNIPIWTAGGPADSTATLSLAPTGNLELRNGSSNSLIWQSSTAGKGVSSASLDESGNLVLRNGSGLNIWASFDNPTDSIVTGQNFTKDQNLTNGIYSFSLLGNGNLTLTWNSTIFYYNSGLNSSAFLHLSSPSLTLSSIGIITLMDPLISIPQNLAYSSDFAQEGNNIFRFVKLDNDGNLRIYSSVKGSGTKTIGWSALSDQCLVYGYCGNMGICSYNDTGPVCGCASLNFEPVDPLDSRKGCKRKLDLGLCRGSESTLVLNHTLFLTYPPELNSFSQVFSAGYQPCGTNCLLTQGCVGSTSLADGTGHCYQKVSSFVSGYQSPSVPSTSFFKICGNPIPNPPTGSAVSGRKYLKLKAWIVVVVVLITVFALLVAEGSLWCWCFRHNPKFGGLSSQYSLLEYASGAPVQFSYKELQRATKGFKEKLGSGGFGAVYKGVLANKTVAAVKRLEGIEQGEKQFRMEVATISSTHHLNLVRLIGFCSEGRRRLLVYEFLKNGSLDNFLFSSDDKLGKILQWESRYKIALGTARGITYLHEECRDCIVHCDVKPENILLDENYNPKVSDFGLAKLTNPKDQKYRTFTSLRGTRGYLAPEWLANLPITSKSDVYSYGMVLLETIGGKRNFDISPETNQKKFWLWAYEEFDKGNIDGIIDKRLSKNEIDMEQLVRAIQVSFWCIQEQPSQRPMMSKVVQMLEGIAEIGRPPAPKAISEVSVGGTSFSISSISSPSGIATSIPASNSSLMKQKILSSKEPESSSFIHSEVSSAPL